MGKRKGSTRAGMRVSGEMTEVARQALRLREGLAAVEEWEKEHGWFTVEEIEAARREVAGGTPRAGSAGDDIVWSRTLLCGWRPSRGVIQWDR